MPAAITSFEREVQNIKFRRGMIFWMSAADYLADVDGTTAINTAGIIKDTVLGGSAIDFGPDNNGRTFTKAFDMELAFALMQTGATELQNLPAVLNPAGEGLYIALTDRAIQPAGAGFVLSDLDAAEKIEFLNASASGELDLNFSREESTVPLVVRGVLDVVDLESLYVEPIVLG